MEPEFKRQFILGNRIVRREWNQTSINSHYFLSTQKDLEVKQIKEDGKELTLIGYIINPHEPNNTNIDCLKSIFTNFTSVNELFEELYIYSGRFVLIGSINDEMIIVTDPCGLRQVYYTAVEGDFWFASQPNLLAEHFDIPKRQDKPIKDFVQSTKYEDYQRSWIGDDCIYEDVYHLMPNTFFDFRLRGKKRYWVNHEKNIRYQDAVDQAANILKGSMTAIVKRGDIVQGLTAGWDSRMLLAASKDVKDDIQFYISLGDNKLNKNTDLKIAKKLATSLNLKLHVMDKLESVREEVANYIEHNVSQGRNINKTRTIQYFYDKFRGKINVNGNISEVVRNTYGYSHPVINADYLVKLLRYEGIPFVKTNLVKWMESVPEYVLEDIEFPDLMYWEQKMGNWCAMQKAEQDLALEDFSPFNNRQLLMTLYNVDKEYRKPDSYILYKSIIEKMWEESLSEPINPVGFIEHLMKIAKKLMSNNTRRKIKRLLA